MAKDINKEPYDEATLTKLEIFEQYLLEWLPVFIQTPSTKRVKICDFCAGSGQDVNGVLGSPLRILKTIEEYRGSIFQQDIAIDVILNEVKADKSDELQIAVDSCFDPATWNSKVTVSCHIEEFQNLFCGQYEELKQQPNLLFIDQNGIKEVTGEIFQMLINLQRTDFLFFISSSTMKRFAGTPEFRSHFPDFDPSNMDNTKWSNCHRTILDYYREQVPEGNTTKLYPFSLKKEENGNIYGLIFGSKNLLGVEKFLDVAWKKNIINGEANFDIDDDIKKQERLLFEDMEQPTKRKVFESHLEDFITSRGEVTNRDVYEFTLNHGHPKSHAKDCVVRLKKEGKVEYKGNIGFSYNSCVKKEPKTIKAKNNG